MPPASYLSLVYHYAHHAPALGDLNVLDVYLAARPPSHCLVEAVIEFRECRVALLVAEGVYVRVDIGVERPVDRRMGDVVGAARLPPYRPQLRRNYKCRNIKEKMRNRNTISLWNHKSRQSPHRLRTRHNEWQRRQSVQEKTRSRAPAAALTETDKRWTRERQDLEDEQRRSPSFDSPLPTTPRPTDGPKKH